MTRIRLTGVTFEGRQEVISKLASRAIILIKRRPNNAHDKNAIEVVTESEESIGWIPRNIAASLAPQIDRGVLFDVRMIRRTGGNGYHYGIEIEVTKSMDNLFYSERVRSIDYGFEDQNYWNEQLSSYEKDAICNRVYAAYNHLVSSGNPSFEPFENYDLLFLFYVSNNVFKVSIMALSDCKFMNNELIELSNSPFYAGEYDLQTGYRFGFNTDEVDSMMHEIIEYFHLLIEEIFEKLAANLLEQLEGKL
ncbi:HIRAN domain-containing protein [Neobacillus niacini]|uniref:HIRAN domain-containing protein n=1 Tax=Neobacillus niacini TaxID=86668 RepID=UPI0039830068